MVLASRNTAMTPPSDTEKRKRAPRGTRPPGVPRGPPRPHRKLAPSILGGRIEKLETRIKRARYQQQEAERHIEAYLKEAKYRADDPAFVPPPEPVEA